MKSVKQWKRSALLQTFENGQGVLMEQAYNNYNQAYNESYNNNLQLAKQSDSVWNAKQWFRYYI